MVSQKVETYIYDQGLVCQNENGVIASAFYDLGGWQDGQFVLNFHKGEMPTFKAERYDSLQTLENAMREFQPDLRKWRYAF